jgi:hypothetical protein
MRRASTSGAATHQDDRAYVELPRQMDFSQNPVEAHTVSAPLPKMQCMMTVDYWQWLIPSQRGGKMARTRYRMDEATALATDATPCTPPIRSRALILPPPPLRRRPSRSSAGSRSAVDTADRHKYWRRD